MSDDLIKRLRDVVIETDYCGSSPLMDEAANRIEQLKRENARLDAGWSDANFRALDAGLKLAKAVEALREIVSKEGYMNDPWEYAAYVLAELEGHRNDHSNP